MEIVQAGINMIWWILFIRNANNQMPDIFF